MVSISEVPLARGFGHDDAQHVHDSGVGHVEQPRQQPADTRRGFMTLGDGRGFGVKPKHGQHRAAALVEARFGDTRLDAFGDRLIARPLVLHLDPPQRRPAYCVGDHDAERERRLRRQRRQHRRMAVQVDIRRHDRCDLGPLHLGKCRRGSCRPVNSALVLAEPACKCMRGRDQTPRPEEPALGPAGESAS